MDNFMRICCVTAVHIQPSEEWINALPNCDVIIIDDSNGKVEINKPNVKMYDYEKQKDVLGDLYDDFDKYFHKSSACKNLGHYIAYNSGYDVMIEIDSDCICPPDVIEAHLTALNMKGGDWVNPLQKKGLYPRGYPYSMRDKEVVANLGLWSYCLDINGADRTPDEPKETGIEDNRIVDGFIPFSGMNFAIKREYIPLMFLIPNFNYKCLKFRRHDDIFGGYIFQSLLKRLDKKITYGLPIVKHDSEVVPEEDAEAEDAMNSTDTMFYDLIDEAMFMCGGGDPLELLKNFNPNFKDSIFRELEEPFNWYKKLFNK